MKGAAAAAANTVPIATGSGDTAFGFVSYSNIVNKPIFINALGNSFTPRMRIYSTIAVAGLWSIAITGFSSVDVVIPIVITNGTAIGTAAWASINTYNATAASGSVIVSGASGNTLGTNQSVQIMVWGI